MLKKVGPRNQVHLLYTDTNSFIYQIDNIDIYKKMNEYHQMFDTSDYKKGDPFGIQLNNKTVLGMMKDEGNGKIMREFIGIRVKAYYCLYENSESEKGERCKKVSSKKHNHRNFFSYTSVSVGQVLSDHPVLRTERVDKIALSPYNDKRYIIPSETATLPWGHYSIPCEEEGEGEEEAVDEQNVRKRASNECRPPAVKRMRLEGEGGPIVAAPLDENMHPTLKNFQTEEEGNDVHGGEQ
ncbi:hypothetical protein TKK_0017609 [Trichogramma kaykai]